MLTSYIKVCTFFILSGLFFAGCNSPTDSGGDVPDSSTAIEDLSVPDTFDWKTHKNIRVELQGYEAGMLRFLAEDGTEYHRGRLTERGSYQFTLTVPSYMNEITVLYRGQEKSFDLNRSAIDYSFEPQTS